MNAEPVAESDRVVKYRFAWLESATLCTFASKE